MKIRNGFVSNSSSSSFIVLLKNKLKTKDEINEHNEKMLNEYGPVLSEKILKCISNKMILSMIDVEYGSESSIKSAIAQTVMSLGYQKTDFEFIELW
jgi:hypothetical protein